MCSQPIEHDAHELRATCRSSAISSAPSDGAPSNRTAVKFRVGRVEIALKASRLAIVPSSRYFAVAAPNDRSRRLLAAARTAAGSAEPTFVPGRTITALHHLEPITAPRPPRPAWRPSVETVA